MIFVKHNLAKGKKLNAAFTNLTKAYNKFEYLTECDKYLLQVENCLMGEMRDILVMWVGVRG